MKLLWLPGWYPNKTEPLTGDFIQRHARAVALYHQVNVIYIVRDKEGKFTKDVLEETFVKDNVHEKIIYYHIALSGIPLLEKFLSVLKYKRLYRQAAKTYLAEEGPPAGVHVHVVNKNGFAARWLKRKYTIPFVVSEQWTAYLPEAVPNFRDLPYLFRMMWRRTMEEASGLTVVSQYLGNAITAIRKQMTFEVIPNVVDSSLFFLTGKKENKPVQFIHISTLGYQKNPEAVLNAFAIVKKTNSSFRLSVFGPEKKDLLDMCANLGLQEQVFFYNEIPQPELALFMQQSDALIFYSRYETFGCVLIEANACGIPVIASDIPVFHETIEEGVNGYFAAGEKPTALAEKIVWFMEQRKNIPDETIALVAKEKYSYERIGRLFSAFYTRVLKN
jgi:glycosyltransferase involved in cell wall biosynthesis